MKGKSISDNRSVENISDKRLRIEVQPVQTNMLEMVKRFVKVHLHCIVSNLKRISKISMLPPPGKFSADAHDDCVQFGKQHLQYNAILPSIVLSYKCCEVYSSLLK